MAEPLTISPDEFANEGLNYASLREQGIALVEQLAGNIWTDYNEHDPGVTTLEQLCYALTELSYRAEFPLQDLLAEKQSGKVNGRRQALFIPRRILPCNPLTEDDYRKLIVDRVPQIANVWLTPYRGRDPVVKGLYEIWLYAPEADPCACNGELSPKTIRRRVRRVYCRHRNLCEDVRAIRFLEQVQTVVSAEVRINNTRTPESTLASLLFNVGNFLAPELRRQPLKNLLDRGETPDQIFNGPLLRNGFIDDDELQSKATMIAVQDVVRVMVRTGGVDSVSKVSVRPGDGPTYSGNSSIPVPEKDILQLDTRSDFTIRLFHNGIECKPDPARVRRELDRLWADYRRTYRLMPQYDLFFAVPQGKYRDLREYYSIQNQYPAVYGINSFGLPGNATPARRGQAKQFKAYLLAFEQLLADFFAQLSCAKDLYSIDRDLRQTYFFQPLTKSVPDVEPLLKENYLTGLKRIAESQDRFVERRNRFLDFLLALYAETLGSVSASDDMCEGQSSEPAGERLLRAKLLLLRHLVASTHNRGRAFDYLAPPSRRNIAGMEIKCRIELNMDVFDEGPAFELASDAALVEPRSAIGSSIDRYADYIEEHFAPIASFEPEAARGDENYRVGTLPGESTVTLVFKSSAEWRLVSRHEDLGSALVAANGLVELSRTASRRGRQLYIIEHTLLRFALLGKDEQYEPGPVGNFIYDFTITAVIATDSDRLNGQEYQTLVREVIRSNTPAHLVVTYCFLTHLQMSEFESLYWAWRRALREHRRQPLIIASTRLRDFLQQCACGTMTTSDQESAR